MKKLLFLLLTPIAPAHALDMSVLSIDRAVDETLKHKPSVIAYHHAIQDAKRKRKAAWSSHIPNISLSQKFYNTKNASRIKSSFVISASQTVLDLAQRDYDRIKGAAVSLAKHQRSTHKDAMRIAVETAFLSSWLLQQKLPQIIFQYKSAKEVFYADKNKNENNLLDKNVWMTSESTYAGQLAIVDSYKDNIAEAEKIIKYYTGISLSLLPSAESAPKLTRLNWNPQQKIIIQNMSYYFQKGLIYRKELKAKQDTINSEASTSQYYTKQYIPSVSLFGQATKNTLRNANSTFPKSAGLTISWNTFDGLSNYFNKSAADARKMKAILEKHDLINQIKLEIQTAYSALQKEMKQFSAQTVSYRQAKNEYVLKKQQLKTGLISNVDFQTAEYTFETARHDWLTQSATTALKELELLYSCGYPPHSMVKNPQI